MYDASKVLLGSTGSSLRAVTNEPADPTDFPAGLAVRKKSDGGLQLAASGAPCLIGVSIGPSLSDTKKTAVVRTGEYIPLRISPVLASAVIGDITFTSKKLVFEGGEEISITLTDGASDGEANIQTDPEVPDTIIVDIEPEVTTAEAIVAAIEADTGEFGAASYVTCEIAEGEEETAQGAATETLLADGDDVAEEGKAVKLDATTGEATTDGTTTAAVYLSGPLTGVYPDETTAWCAYIALPGGF